MKRIHALSNRHRSNGLGHAPIKRQHRAGNRWGGTHPTKATTPKGGAGEFGAIPTGTATTPHSNTHGEFQ